MTNPKTGWTSFCVKKPWRPASVLLVLFMVAGCSRSPEVASSSNAKTKAELDASIADEPITDEQATKFANELSKAIASNNSKAVAQLIAWPEIVARAVEPYDMAEQDKGDLIRDTVNGAPSITKEIANTVKQGGVYRLVRVKQRGSDPFALFRLIAADGTLNYHLVRIRRIRERVRADQFFSAAQGGEVSDSIRQKLVQAAKNFMDFEKVSEEQKRFVEDLEIKQRLTDAVAFGFDEQALQIYNGLPDRLKMGRIPMLCRIKIIPIEETTNYANAVKHYLAKFPDDPAGGMIALDAGATVKDVELLQQGHRAITEWSGGDPYLDLLVGAGLSQFGRTDLALGMTQAVDPSNAGISGAHSLKLKISLAVDDHAEALNQLRILKDKYGINPKQLEEIEQFQSFVESPEYQQWKND